MGNNLTKADECDASHVTAMQDNEVQYLIEQTGISPGDARELIKAYGKDRATLLNAAKMLLSSRVNVRSSRV